MFWRKLYPTYEFDKAKTIVFEADFLGNWLDTGHGRKYSQLRDPGKNMSSIINSSHFYP